jgi:hypothetical protein
MRPGFPRRGEDGKSYFPRREGLCKRPSLTAGEFVTSSTGERGILGESEKSEPNPISEAIKQGELSAFLRKSKKVVSTRVALLELV